MEYIDVNGNEKFIGDHGRSTQEQFDEALTSLPNLIANARQGDEKAGNTANKLLWQLANEGFNTRTTIKGTFKELFSFGKSEVVA